MRTCRRVFRLTFSKDASGANYGDITVIRLWEIADIAKLVEDVETAPVKRVPWKAAKA
jgi:hypothetical protein